MFALRLASRVVTVFGVLLLTVLAIQISTQIARSGDEQDVFHDPRRLARLQVVVSVIAPIGQAVRWHDGSKAIADDICTWYEHLAESLGRGSCTARVNGLARVIATVDVRLDALRAGGDEKRNRIVTGHYVVDSNRLLEAIRVQRINAAEAQSALQALIAQTRSGQPLLERLKWRELAVTKQEAERFPRGGVAMLADNVFDVRNHWRMVPGCTYVRLRTESSETAADRGLGYYGLDANCSGQAGSASADAKRIDPSTQPPDWASVAGRLQEWVRHGPRLPTGLGAPTNAVNVFGHAVAQGAHVLTTIDGNSQAQAQWVVDCMVGKSAACERAGIEAKQWATMYEQAAARMLGLVVLDIRTGDIEVLASSHSECFRQQYDGPGRDAGCPDLPVDGTKRDFELENHALFSEAMPGSVIKPIAAIAMMRDPAYAKRLLGSERAAFQLELARSLSPLFHDRLFCKDKRFEGCGRAGGLVEAASLVGWNTECVSSRAGGAEATITTDQENVGAMQRKSHPRAPLAVDGVVPPAHSPSLRCGEIDVGVPQDRSGPHAELAPFVSALRIHGGRIGLQTAADRSWSPIADLYTPEWANECSSNRWRRCRGGNDSAIDLLAEAWGQGNALASPIGVAMMFAQVGAAADGAREVAMPRLIRGYVAGEPTEFPSSHRAQTVPPDHARLIVGGLAASHSHALGTSNSACKAVLGQASCSRIDWIAGKTGTPPFRHDTLSVSARAELCRALKGSKSEVDESRHGAWSDCLMRPYKWYAGLIKSPSSRLEGGNGRWDKAIVVLAERNWNSSGEIDAVGDRGQNVAARVAFEFIARTYR